MKVRAKANGNVLDLPDAEAEALIATGIYEKADVQDDDGQDDAGQGKRKGTYRRRDLKPEE